MPKYTSVASCIAVVLLYCMIGLFIAYRAIKEEKKNVWCESILRIQENYIAKYCIVLKYCIEK